MSYLCMRLCHPTSVCSLDLDAARIFQIVVISICLGDINRINDRLCLANGGNNTSITLCTVENWKYGKKCDNDID